MNLSNYTFEELIKLKNEVENRIYSISDGFLYLCKVRSYGRNWVERPKNTYILDELCCRYNGDDGIVDIFTTNPDLDIQNYGDVYYIKSEEEYNVWKEWDYMTRNIPFMEKEIEDWENLDNVPFSSRPLFQPWFTRETIEEEKKLLENFNMDFTHPVRLKKNDFESE
jgi:hypothetical protein